MECALDGIHTTENNVIDNIINRDVEEDAVTIGKNITIRNSKFYFCQDKCFQMNSINYSNNEVISSLLKLLKRPSSPSSRTELATSFFKS